MSFKGYAKGYAQLVHSPVAFVNSPMIINMNKRLTGESTPGVVASLQPRLSIAPRGPDAKYSGVHIGVDLETTRLPFTSIATPKCCCRDTGVSVHHT